MRESPRRDALGPLSLGLSVDGCARPLAGRYRDDVGTQPSRRPRCGGHPPDERRHPSARSVDAILCIPFDRFFFIHVTLTRVRIHSDRYVEVLEKVMDASGLRERSQHEGPRRRWPRLDMRQNPSKIEP